MGLCQPGPALVVDPDRGVGGPAAGLSIAIQAATEEGLDSRWWAAALGVTGLTGVISYPFFRVWLRKTALPSVRLPQAVRASGPRRLEASPRDWRRWALFTGLVLLVGGAAMLDVPDRRARARRHRRGRRRGDARRLGARDPRGRAAHPRRSRQAEGRRYFAACRRPTGVGNRLVWLPRRARGGRLRLDVRPRGGGRRRGAPASPAYSSV